MVVHDIYDDSDTMLVGCFNKSLIGIRPTVTTFNCKGMRRIVTPRNAAFSENSSSLLNIVCSA